MKLFSIQFAVLIGVCAISICLASEEEEEEEENEENEEYEKKEEEDEDDEYPEEEEEEKEEHKKEPPECPPKGVKLHPIEPEKQHLVRNWKMAKCFPSLYCDKVSCMEITKGERKKGIYFQGSCHNESSSKVWATTAYLTREEPGVYKGNFEDKRANGRFYYLLVNEKLLIWCACFTNKHFGLWVGTKNGKLTTHEEKLVEETLKKNGIKYEDLKPAVNKHCAKLKSSVRH